MNALALSIVDTRSYKLCKVNALIPNRLSSTFIVAIIVCAIVVGCQHVWIEHRYTFIQYLQTNICISIIYWSYTTERHKRCNTAWDYITNAIASSKRFALKWSHNSLRAGRGFWTNTSSPRQEIYTWGRLCQNKQNHRRHIPPKLVHSLARARLP